MSRGLLLALALGAVSPLARGTGVSPYLPLDMPPHQARLIERVLILAGRPVLKRPIPVATVRAMLPRACARDAELCAQVEDYLDELAGTGVSEAQFELATSGDHAVPMANRHGLQSDDAWVATAAAHWQPGTHVMLGVGAIARPGKVLPTGSLLSFGGEYVQIDAGFRDHWSSSLSDSSFLLSTEAATMPSITVSSTRPIGRMGMDYELFLARMSRSDRIAYQGSYTDGHPLLAGVHFAIQPVPGWSLGVNRQLQFAGGARPGASLSGLFHAFINPSRYDNTRTGNSTDEEFGNQQAAWTSSFIFPGRRPVVISMEYGGEDTSHSTAGRLGNAALSVGVRVPDLWRRIGLTYEISEWQNAWYLHHLYQDGLVNDGNVLGHWAADRRLPNDAVGAWSQMLRLDRPTRSGGSIELQYRSVQNAGYSTFSYHRGHELLARYARPLGRTLVGGALTVGRDVLGEHYWRASGFVSLLQGGTSGGYHESSLDEAGNDDEHAFFVDVGVALNRVRIDIDNGTIPKTTTPARAAPHLGLGVRREVTEHGDLGVRIEYDRVDEHTLLAVRALDYRYRLSDRMAWTAFAGVARYDLATPAYGYYFGAGLQRRDVLPHWDLNFDLRYGDKIARDHVLPSESALREPDSFYDFNSVALTLSRRF